MTDQERKALGKAVAEVLAGGRIVVYDAMEAAFLAGIKYQLTECASRGCMWCGALIAQPQADPGKGRE